MISHWLKRIAYWVLPHGVHEYARGWNYKALWFYLNNRALFVTNVKHKDIHKGKRCFVMGGAPSLNKLDLLPLKDEIVFCLSSGFLHKDYPFIRPRYHCTPAAHYDTLLTKPLILSYLKDLEKKALGAELFLGGFEHELAASHGVFKDYAVNWLCFGGKLLQGDSRIPDLSRVIPAPQSAPLVAIMVAMYMGFKEIYLIGTDYDAVITREYTHAYGPTVFQWKYEDLSIDHNGKVLSSYGKDFKVLGELWSQFEALRHIAEANGIRICNASAGGILDVFERVDYSSLFPSHSSGK